MGKTKTTMVDLEPLAERLEEIREDVKELSFELGTTYTATVMTREDSYKKKPVTAGVELFWTATRTGKRGDLIFTFHPADAQDWKSLEMSGEEVSRGYMPTFSEMLEAKLGCTLHVAKRQRSAWQSGFKDENGNELPIDPPVVDYKKNDAWGSF